MLIKELKQSNGNHRVTLTKTDIDKIGVKEGDYVEIKKLGDNGGKEQD